MQIALYVDGTYYVRNINERAHNNSLNFHRNPMNGEGTHTLRDSFILLPENKNSILTIIRTFIN